MVTFFSVTISSVGIALLSNNPDLKIGATDQYSCDLPIGYTEISDVVAYGMANSNVENPYKFRGTVTKVMGNEAYLQRVNQTTFKLDAIKLFGIEDYSIHIQEGNVVDIEGGRLKRPYGEQVEYFFSGTSVYNVAFDENPTGYEARQYGSWDDFYYGEDVNENLNNAFARYVSLGNAKYIGYHTETMNERDYTVIILQDLFDNERFDCLLNISVEDTETVMQSLDGIFELSHAVRVNCIYTYTLTYDNPVLTIFSKDDVTDDGSYIDTNVISSQSASYMIWAQDGMVGFPVYTMVGKDESIVYAEFSEFYYTAMSNFVINVHYAQLMEATNTNPGHENEYTYYMSATKDSTLLIVINPVDDTFVVANDYWNIFTGFNPLGGGSPRYFVNGAETAYCQITAGSKTLENKGQLSFDLGSYGIDIIKDKYDNMYIPVSVLGNILLNTHNFSMGWNGKYYFYIPNTIGDGTLLGWYLYDTPYSYYDTETSQRIVYPTRTQAFADFTYNEFCFTLEHYYGLRNYKIPQDSSADAQIAASGYKSDLLSTDVATYEEAICNFITTWVGDGHARYIFPSGYAGANYSYYTSLGSDYSGGRNPRMLKLNADFAEIGQLRENANKEVGLEILDNLAIVRFDEFIKYRKGDSKDYDLSQDYAIVHKAGSDLLFRKAFNTIKDTPGIQNVVIDLTYNDGGEIDAVPFLEAYMVEDVTFTVKDGLTGECLETHYMLDLDYDGIFGDTYANQYKFFVLTSNASFSCGNALPTVLKEHGITIIGETSGGGECAVGYAATANGTIFESSSNFHMGHYDYDLNKFVGNDSGVTPDYAYPRSKFYDTEYLKDFLNNLAV